MFPHRPKWRLVHQSIQQAKHGSNTANYWISSCWTRHSWEEKEWASGRNQGYNSSSSSSCSNPRGIQCNRVQIFIQGSAKRFKSKRISCQSGSTKRSAFLLWVKLHSLQWLSKRLSCFFCKSSKLFGRSERILLYLLSQIISQARRMKS